jgi:hypothetical protein
MFEQFVELQDRILAIVARSETFLLDETRRDVGGLGRTRWDLARTLRDYQSLIHAQIFDRYERRADQAGQLAQQMKSDCIRAGEDFRQYVLKWSVISILDHWDDYRPAALEAIAKVRSQLAKERAGVTDLLRVSALAA